MVGDLYYLTKESFNKQNSCNSVSRCFEHNKHLAMLWHARLGHVSFKRLRHVDGVAKCDYTELMCPVCPVAKQTRLSFPTSTITSEHVFDLIHVDLWGPYKLKSITNAVYMLTIVDDYSRFCWTYMLKTKDQVLLALKSFFNYVLTHFGKRIKVLRTDNGTEFVNSACSSFLQEHGTLHQRTCVYTPQQNGVVERKHRTLLNIARTLLFQSKLPSNFWSELLLVATHITNRLPSENLGWKTPYERLYGKQVNYTYFRTIGCLCYATNTTPHKQKFDPRAFPCVLLGYAPNQKAYKLYCLTTKTLIHSRDVVFMENIFPFHHTRPADVTTFVLPNCAADTDYIPHQISEPDFPPESTSPDLVFPSSSSNLPVSPTGTDAGLLEPNDTVTSIVPLSPVVRRSTRARRTPAWFNDYDIDASSPSQTYFTSSHMSFIAQLSKNKEPCNYNDAKQNMNWVNAMHLELSALERNNTWMLTDLPPNTKPVGCKWVYRIKYNADGSIDRYKARLVAKGYNQLLGLDYHHTFSPVAKLVTVRVFLTIAAAYSWNVQQLDINNAYLHGAIDEDIYMEVPPGYDKATKGQVCKLQRSLYGLKQAGRQWNKELTATLMSQGFSQSSFDHCLFTKGHGDSFIALLVYVDDCLISSPSADLISDLKGFLDKKFTIKDLGDVKYFLGIEVARTAAGIFLTQHKFIMDIIHDTGLHDAKPADSPYIQGMKLRTAMGHPLQDAGSYRRLIGRLLYLSMTRPDISYAVQQLSQFMQHPHQSHLKAALTIVKYLKGTSYTGLFLPSRMT